MSCLDATFTLTPQSPLYSDSSLYNWAYLFCNGVDFSPFSPTDLSSLYASNRFFFEGGFAGDPNLDYAQFLFCLINLQTYADQSHSPELSLPVPQTRSAFHPHAQ